MYLAGYNFEIHYQKGTANPVDALSKRPDYNKSNRPQDLT
jgi:hypothetical protein